MAVETPKGKPARARTWWIRGGIAAAVVVVLAYLAPKLVHSITHITTDDAYIQATVVPISPEVAGKVVSVFVDDNRQVAAGDSLVKIDPADYLLAVQDKTAALAASQSEESRAKASITEQEKARARAQAEWTVAATKADLAEKERVREQQLIEGGAASQSQYDGADAAARTARAGEAAAHAAVGQIEANLSSLPTEVERARSRVRQAQAALDTAERNLERTVLRAPVSGRIARKNVDPGRYVQIGQPLLAIVQDEDPWLVANFKETQIRRMRPMQPVEIRVDAYPGRVFRGHIESFQPGTGAVFSLLPPENATGNFVKVTQRLPVKIRIDSPPDPAHPLYPGLSASAAVDVRAKGDETPR